MLWYLVYGICQNCPLQDHITIPKAVNKIIKTSAKTKKNMFSEEQKDWVARNYAVYGSPTVLKRRFLRPFGISGDRQQLSRWGGL